MEITRRKFNLGLLGIIGAAALPVFTHSEPEQARSKPRSVDETIAHLRHFAQTSQTEDAFLYDLRTGLLYDVGHFELKEDVALNDNRMDSIIARGRSYWLAHNHPGEPEDRAAYFADLMQQCAAAIHHLEEEVIPLLQAGHGLRGREGQQTVTYTTQDVPAFTRKLERFKNEFSEYRKWERFYRNDTDGHLRMIMHSLPSEKDVRVFTSVARTHPHSDFSFPIFTKAGYLMLQNPHAYEGIRELKDSIVKDGEKIATKQEASDFFHSHASRISGATVAHTWYSS